jgi:hypothetical protein
VAALSGAPQLRTLRLNSCHLAGPDAHHIAHLLDSCPNLCALELNFNDFRAPGAAVLAQTMLLHAHERPTPASPDRDALEPDERDRIVAMASRASRRGRAGSAGLLASAGGASLRPPFRGQLQLQELQIRCNGLGPAGVAALAVAAQATPSLRVLNVADNGAGPIGAARLAQSLIHAGKGFAAAVRSVCPEIDQPGAVQLLHSTLLPAEDQAVHLRRSKP